MKIELQKIISGGQTGVDRAALDVALESKIACGGWCPKNRKAEDGNIPAYYPLQETPSEDYLQRTEWNVRDSDGTLILTFGSPSSGTVYTVDCAKKLGKPYLTINLEQDCSKTNFLDWLKKNRIKILNVAGPRESHAMGKIHSTAKKILKNLLIILFLLFSTITSAFAGHAALTITPAQIFTDQDQQVLFTLTVDCHGTTCPETVELILWKDETRQKSSARWAMQDKGLWGDEKAGDHIYSQIAYFKKGLPTTLTFTAAGISDAQLQIIPRPTFWELMQGVFKKLRGLSLRAAPKSSTKEAL